MNKAALQELVEASVGSLRDCSEQYAALKDRHRALVARVAVLESAIERAEMLFKRAELDTMHSYVSSQEREGRQILREAING